MQLFEGRKRNSIVFYSHFRKLHLCTLNFLYLFFACKIKAIELPRTPSNKDSAKVRENHSCSFTTAAHYKCQQLHRLPSRCRNLHFHLCFGGRGGMLGLSLAACASLGMQEGRFKTFYFSWARGTTYHNEGSIFWT